jgi:hypothetical protein
MGKSWRGLPNRGLNNKKEIKMKSSKCTVCAKQTYQPDRICVLCRNYITRMYEELIALITIDRKQKAGKIRIR